MKTKENYSYDQKLLRAFDDEHYNRSVGSKNFSHCTVLLTR